LIDYVLPSLQLYIYTYYVKCFVNSKLHVYKGPVQKAYLHRDREGSNPLTILF